MQPQQLDHEEVLELVAKDGTIDFEKWPDLLDPLIERLEHIVHNDFPMPTIPPTLSNTHDTPSLIPSSYPIQEVNPQSNNNKENAPPSQLQTSPGRPPVPAFRSSVPIEQIPDSQLQSTDDALPPPLVRILSSIKYTLRTYFSLKPPHTIQRLAELILQPTRHYSTLPSYLRAVDRVVSVSSGADIFPLPASLPIPGGLIDTNLVNGVNGSGSSSFVLENDALGSDESLGGALLTPIPWLRDSALPGGNNDGILDFDSSPNSSPDVSPSSSSSPSTVPPQGSGAVTGELTRQEQEAGVVHITIQEHQVGSSLVAGRDGVEAQGDDDVEEIPHARGPAILGVEDMGLQNRTEVQFSLSPSATGINDVPADGSATDLNTTLQASAESDKLSSADLKEDADMDADGDFVIGDIHDKPEGESSGNLTEAASTAMSIDDMNLETEVSIKPEMGMDGVENGGSIKDSEGGGRMER
ncbi:hypothetical protein PAAG_07060 [Paracoccidioides lutzii Pb01]|uniref:Protein phosphatase 4 core regulatory subunit R2 n=1 Tax=Paracoccidioides lutzii (strain ATCC MYA-826 / Pb01) TaxID=502779 RepID=C1H883_PARBA|nr:hypothetical protein PAAG_07060 [Paracoccidioides lutzii Pb01]EEH36642.2 hypothetical protein PAAG_07060 [Paracoccidioides lutzii Pb01]